MTGESAPDDTGRPQEGKRFIRVRQRIRTRRGALAAGTVVALLAAGLGTWATDTWPFDGRDRYCWGAWEEDGGPDILGDEAFDGDDARSRTAEETAPTAARPQGRCVLAVRSAHTFSDGDKGVQDTRVTVTYGPAPEKAAARLEWINTFVGGRAMPLPEGLPGAVDGSRGLLVLPESCDTRDGRPTAVTLRAEEKGPDDIVGGTDLGGADAAVELLLAAADRGMRAAGCAPAKPPRVTSPLLRLPEKDDTSPSSAVCRIPGLDVGSGLTKEAALRVVAQAGAVTRDRQACSVRIGRSVRLGEREDTRIFDALMIREPRLGALLDGVTGSKPPAPGWRGTGVFADGHQVVRARCAGRPTTFLLLGSSARETKGHFTTFTDAVTRRLGCAPLAPKAPATAAGENR
ncbi:hypothetical protein [Streptomyces spectabilis]|uniref:Uncharacterized protein n=2 Tax=Streptomyces spectabilis TaxID=68270 RepID=A0A7W8B2Q6_STRST|nr:hypothetical protein [Streptomyces spectabilis]MBB5109279.1 hypothetical protein [Streptomyces spectabilis]MCI3905983.1 hypothetical protein [Streptomyces spectabilis]GGV05539.1 hypothetical protein GCM10010245_11530 [Streptomyces spectabilis]